MMNYQDKVVGVLQVINRKYSRDDIVTPENAEQVVIEFNEQVKHSMPDWRASRRSPSNADASR